MSIPISRDPLSLPFLYLALPYPLNPQETPATRRNLFNLTGVISQSLLINKKANSEMKQRIELSIQDKWAGIFSIHQRTYKFYKHYIATTITGNAVPDIRLSTLLIKYAG